LLIKFLSSDLNIGTTLAVLKIWGKSLLKKIY